MTDNVCLPRINPPPTQFPRPCFPAPNFLPPPSLPSCIRPRPAASACCPNRTYNITAPRKRRPPHPQPFSCCSPCLSPCCCGKTSKPCGDSSAEVSSNYNNCNFYCSDLPVGAKGIGDNCSVTPPTQDEQCDNRPTRTKQHPRPLTNSQAEECSYPAERESVTGTTLRQHRSPGGRRNACDQNNNMRSGEPSRTNCRGYRWKRNHEDDSNEEDCIYSLCPGNFHKRTSRSISGRLCSPTNLFEEHQKNLSSTTCPLTGTKPPAFPTDFLLPQSSESSEIISQRDAETAIGKNTCSRQDISLQTRREQALNNNNYSHGGVENIRKQDTCTSSNISSPLSRVHDNEVNKALTSETLLETVIISEDSYKDESTENFGSMTKESVQAASWDEARVPNFDNGNNCQSNVNLSGNDAIIALRRSGRSRFRNVTRKQGRHSRNKSGSRKRPNDNCSECNLNISVNNSIDELGSGREDLMRPEINLKISSAIASAQVKNSDDADRVEHGMKISPVDVNESLDCTGIYTRGHQDCDDIALGFLSRSDEKKSKYLEKLSKQSLFVMTVLFDRNVNKNNMYRQRTPVMQTYGKGNANHGEANNPNWRSFGANPTPSSHRTGVNPETSTTYLPPVAQTRSLSQMPQAPMSRSPSPGYPHPPSPYASSSPQPHYPYAAPVLPNSPGGYPYQQHAQAHQQYPESHPQQVHQQNYPYPQQPYGPIPGSPAPFNPYSMQQAPGGYPGNGGICCMAFQPCVPFCQVVSSQRSNKKKKRTPPPRPPPPVPPRRPTRGLPKSRSRTPSPRRPYPIKDYVPPHSRPPVKKPCCHPCERFTPPKGYRRKLKAKRNCVPCPCTESNNYQPPPKIKSCSSCCASYSASCCSSCCTCCSSCSCCDCYSYDCC